MQIKKIPNTSKLVKKTDSNTTITEVKNLIPSITGLVATKAPTEKVTEIENKISNTNSLVKETN